MQRRQVCVLLATVAIGGTGVLHANLAGDQRQPSQAYVDWVAEVLKRMESIKPGMTRKNLLTVFTTEGGLSTPLRRVYVSQDCPYFKVDVEFQAVGRPDRDQDGRITMVEDDRDRILTISTPFLQFSVSD